MSSLLTHEVQKKDFHWKNRNIQGPILKINKQITKGRKRGRKGGKEGRKERRPFPKQEILRFYKDQGNHSALSSLAPVKLIVNVL